MDITLWRTFMFAFFVIVAAAFDGAYGYAMVSGTVFCDQCKDGQISLFDYPLNGAKVTMTCPGSDGQITREETTNWLGSYGMRFDGTPNLSGCYAQVAGGSSGCGAVAGQPRYLRLMFSMFDMAMYSVDPLLAQPAEAMPFCPRYSPSVPVPVPVAPVRPPPVVLPQPPQRPPLPGFPPMPPTPFLEASACPHQRWMIPEYRCYWKVVTPDTKVAVAFGLIAARRYGTDMTLGQGMRGRGDPYRTLLREGTTALLNSYNSIQFPYHPFGVIQRMNFALMGSTRHVLHTALNFMKANSGATSNATCNFTPCK